MTSSAKQWCTLSLDGIVAIELAQSNPGGPDQGQHEAQTNFLESFRPRRRVIKEGSKVTFYDIHVTNHLYLSSSMTY